MPDTRPRRICATTTTSGRRVFYQVYNIGNTETFRRQDGLGHQAETVLLSPSYPNPFENGVATTNANNDQLQRDTLAKVLKLLTAPQRTALLAK